jgi:OOP family OmpA-OmpF porin
LKGHPISLSKLLNMSVVIAGFAWPMNAVAQSEGLYISGGIGGVLPHNSDIEGGGINSEVSFNPGFSVLAAIGSTLGGNWRGEAELAHRTADVDEVSGAANSSGSVNGTAFLINGYHDFKNGSKWVPYVGAGVGLMRLDVDGASPIGGSRVDDNDWVMAAQGIAGVGYQINDRLGLFTDYRFLATTDPNFTTAAGIKVESEYSEHRIVIGLRWSFGGAKLRPKPLPTLAKAIAASLAPVKAAGPAPVASPPKAKSSQAPVLAKAPEVARRFLLFFDWDRSNLNDDARAIVRDAAEASTQVPVTVIEATGHADRSGPNRYNMGLSLRRSETVKEELKRLGIPAGEIVILYRGEDEALVATADGLRERKNRRVEIILK